MKILFVEDSGEAAYPLKEYLEDDGHEVFLACNVIAAYSQLTSKKPDCLIVDLNMEPRGLKPEEVSETQGGLFTGWVWLKNYVFSKNNSMRQRTIILTGYERDFKDKVPSEEKGGVKVISKKTGQGDIYEEILKLVNTIGKGLKNQAKEKRK